MAPSVGTLPFLDHGAVEFAADPHGCLRAAREESPVARTPTGVGILTYAGCSAVIADPDFQPGVFEMVQRLHPTGQRHALGAPCSAPRARTTSSCGAQSCRGSRHVRVEVLRARTAALVDDLLVAVGTDGGCEFMGEVATPIPPTVFCWMVGCDVERGPELRHWSSIALRAFSGDPSVMQDVAVAIHALRRFADDLIEEKQRIPGNDLTSALLDAVARGDLALDDVRSLLVELLSASVDNTTHSMGLAVWLLARHPDEWSTVASGSAPVDRARWRNARASSR